MGLRTLRCWLAACLLLLPGLVGAAAPPDDAARLSADMTQLLDRTGMAGVAWATVDASGQVRTGAAGYANSSQRTALRVDHKLHVGSVTKTLLATGLLQLASDGRVDLDAPVARYLPALAFDNRWPDSPVRVRHLLDHTAGLDDLRLWQMFSRSAGPDVPLAAAFARDRSVLAVRSRPGSRFSYSNLGYALAGMVIEAVTGERYERWLDRELLAPLGMRDSTFGFVTQAGPHADPRLAWGHHDRDTPVAALPVYVRPAAQFTTTVQDLARFARFLLGDGRVDGRVLVQPALLRSMGRAQGTQAAQHGLAAGYALGLSRRDRHGVVGLCHAGSVVGFHAMLCLFPDNNAPDTNAPDAHAPDGIGGRAFVTVQNTDGDGLDTSAFDARLVRALGLSPLAPAPTVAADTDLAQWQGRYVPAPNRFARFEYADLLFASQRLAWTGQALELHALGAEVRALSPLGAHRYRIADRVGPSHVLIRGEGGERLLSTGQMTWRRIDGLQFALLATSLALGLLGLLWFALVVPVRGLLRREPAVTPALLAIGLLLVPVLPLAVQDYARLGDPTVGSIALYAATLALPALMAWQALRSLRRRQGLWRGRLNAAAALLVLQWCAVLAWWGLLPFALWR